MSVQEIHRPLPTPIIPTTVEPIQAPVTPENVVGEKRKRIAAAFHEAAIPPSLATGLAMAFEIICLTLAGILTQKLWISDALFLDWRILGPVIGAPLLTALVLQASNGYDLSLLRRHQMRLGRVLMSWAGVVGVFAVALIVGDFAPVLPRSWFPVWLVVGLVTLTIATALSSTVVNRLTRAGRLQRRAVIVGGGPLAESLITALETTGNNELKILGIFDDRTDERSPESQQGYPKLGSTNDLVEFARIASVDLMIVSLPMAAETRLLQVLKKLWVLPVDIRLAAHANKLRFRPRSYSYIGAVPFLDMFDRPIAGWDSVVKRAFDIFFASLAIIMLSPLMLAAAIAVRFSSPGPILFRQKRYGFNNEVISVLKFRSMYHHLSDPNAKVVVTRGDARVTRVGRFIRKTSIDELPQLFNVLKGDLSLVGPRPHAVNAHTAHQLWEEVVDGYFARHKVKPGVTGWAQINGLRGEVDNQEKIQGRVDHDLHYIENWSVLFDLYILLLTPFRILNQDNAY